MTDYSSEEKKGSDQEEKEDGDKDEGDAKDKDGDKGDDKDKEIKGKEKDQKKDEPKDKDSDKDWKKAKDSEMETGVSGPDLVTLQTEKEAEAELSPTYKANYEKEMDDIFDDDEYHRKMQKYRDEE